MTKPSKQAQSKQAQSKQAVPQQFLRLAELLEYVGMVVERGIPGSVWVQAEIAGLTDRRHLYLDLVQHDQDGREIAKTRANIWARERARIEGEFRRATGGSLRADLKVLLSVVPDFHPQYGFSLTVVDLAPEFTVGDMQQKLVTIRETLAREGAFERNRRLPLPPDFTRVAVLAPRGAAGLGDFRREADRLEEAGICAFSYFEALFQGKGAPASLLSALGSARLEHAARAFDALAIIRGGGASTDLAWLNDEELARSVSGFPAPVITGIGHARDDTILDEIAARRCDTPSKAIGFIARRIRESANGAWEHHRDIQRAGGDVLLAASARVEALHLRAKRAARAQVQETNAGVDALMRQILGLTPRRTLKRGYALARSGGRVVTSAEAARETSRLTLEFFDGEVNVTHDL